MVQRPGQSIINKDFREYEYSTRPFLTSEKHFLLPNFLNISENFKGILEACCALVLLKFL